MMVAVVIYSVKEIIDAGKAGAGVAFAETKAALESRGLSTAGRKAKVEARLAAALAKEVGGGGETGGRSKQRTTTEEKTDDDADDDVKMLNPRHDLDQE
jgi:hypothetical protein